MAPTTTPTRMSAWLEQAWLIRYLDRQLAREEARWFEAYAMDRLELLTTIETDTRLRDALAAAASIRHTDVSFDGGGRPGGATNSTDTPDEGIARAGTHDADSTPATGNSSTPRSLERIAARSRASMRRWLAQPARLALAASLLLGIGVGSTALRTRGIGDRPVVIASPTRIIFDAMRGEGNLPRVDHATSTSAYVLVEIAVPRAAEQVTLHVGDGQERALARSPDGVVTFLADRNTLAAAADAHLTYVAGGRTQTRPLSLQPKGSLK